MVQNPIDYHSCLYSWLVVDLPLWKMMDWKSVGIMTLPWKVIKFLFQTTNQKRYFQKGNMGNQSSGVRLVEGSFNTTWHWLVVSTILKNISQWEGLSHILWKIINVPNHQPAICTNSLLGHGSFSGVYTNHEHQSGWIVFTDCGNGENWTRSILVVHHFTNCDIS